MKKTLIFILTVFLSIEISAQITLENDTIVNKYFDKSEIKELHKLVIFFDNIVLNNCVLEDSLAICYTKYYKEIYETAILTGNIDFKLDRNKLNDTVDSLSKSTFNKIWKYRDFVHRKTGEHIQELQIKLQSNYFDFIIESAKVDSKWKAYYDNIMTAGDISPTLISGVLYNCEQFNFDFERERLFLAIHHLTILYRRELD